jgi:hypothetical protein
VIESETLIATYPVAAAATALPAGLASSISPCTAAAVPLVVGYVGGYADGSRRRAFLYAAAFVLGLALAFTGVGLAIALAGAILLPAGGLWRGVLISRPRWRGGCGESAATNDHPGQDGERVLATTQRSLLWRHPLAGS